MRNGESLRRMIAEESFRLVPHSVVFKHALKELSIQGFMRNMPSVPSAQT
jgi:hypothetical protein